LNSQVTKFLQASLGTGEKNSLVAIIGLSKNAGKTTLLNWLLQEAGTKTLGVITTGRDGEDVDLITNESKPKVHLHANVIFSTFAEEIEKHAAHVEVLEKLPYRAGGRNLWLARTRKPIQSEIVGPASVEAQVTLAKHILSLGAKQVFIDGSMDRKAISLQEQVDTLILVVSPEIGREKQIFSEVNRLYCLSKIPIFKTNWKSEYISYQTEGGKWKPTTYKSLLGQEREIIQSLDLHTDMNTIYLPCTVTDKGFPILKSFLQHFEGDLVVRNPYLLQVSVSNLDWLVNNCGLRTVFPFHLKGIAVNSYASNEKHLPSDILRSEIRNMIGNLPVIDVKEII
jgi:hypothetical protein